MDLLEEVNFDVRDVDYAVSSKIFSHGGSFGIAVSLDFIFGIFAFFSINHHLINVVGKETLRLRLKPIETNSECTAVCVMIIYTFEDFSLEKGHRGAPLIFTCN